PPDARVQLYYGELYRLQAQHAIAPAERDVELVQARAAYERALTLDPALAEAHRQLGLLYYAMRDLAHARDELEQYLALAPPAPATLAMSAAAMADLAPGRFCLGLGAGSQPIVEAWNGGKFALPATRVREMTHVVRAALAGERVVFKGKTLSVDGFRLSRPP